MISVLVILILQPGFLELYNNSESHIWQQYQTTLSVIEPSLSVFFLFPARAPSTLSIIFEEQPTKLNMEDWHWQVLIAGHLSLLLKKLFNRSHLTLYHSGSQFWHTRYIGVVQFCKGHGLSTSWPCPADINCWKFGCCWKILGAAWSAFHCLPLLTPLMVCIKYCRS